MASSMGRFLLFFIALRGFLLEASGDFGSG